MLALWGLFIIPNYEKCEFQQGLSLLMLLLGVSDVCERVTIPSSESENDTLESLLSKEGRLKEEVDPEVTVRDGVNDDMLFTKDAVEILPLPGEGRKLESETTLPLLSVNVKAPLSFTNTDDTAFTPTNTFGKCFLRYILLLLLATKITNTKNPWRVLRMSVKALGGKMEVF